MSETPAIDKRAAFLTALGAFAGDVKAACRESGASRASVYRWRADATFATAWDTIVQQVPAAPTPSQPSANDAKGGGDVKLHPSGRATSEPSLSDIRDAIGEIEDQIRELKAESKAAQADFPRHALAARMGGSPDSQGRADALRAKIGANAVLITEAEGMLEVARATESRLLAAEREQNARDRVRKIVELLDQARDLVPLVDGKVAELVKCVRGILERERQAWTLVLPCVSHDLAHACYPDERVIGKAIAAALVHAGIVTTDDLAQLSPVGFEGRAFSPPLGVIVANHAAAMLSRFTPSAPVKVLDAEAVTSTSYGMAYQPEAA